MTHTGRAALLLVVTLGAGSSARDQRPFDFAGRWLGPIRAQGQRFVVTADFAATGATTFAGAATVAGPNGTVVCSATGERTRKTAIALVCEDGTAASLTGRLNTRRSRVKGKARLTKGTGRTRGRFKLVKQPVAAVCGDGIVEPGEQCDDGNTAGADGCGPTCAIEVTTDVAEVEPNDDFPQATAVSPLPALVHGSISPAVDLDFFRIEITGSDLVLETFDGSGQGSCQGGTDTFLELRGPDGTSIVATNNDGGLGGCSRLELHGLAPGVYYPCVRGALGPVSAYTLLVTAP